MPSASTYNRGHALALNDNKTARNMLFMHENINLVLNQTFSFECVKFACLFFFGVVSSVETPGLCSLSVCLQM